MSTDSEVPPSDFEVVIASPDSKYRLTGRSSNRDSFTLKIINEDFTERWTSSYSAGFIDEITHKAGCAKRITVFWKMLVKAALGESQTVTVEILTEIELQRMSGSRISGDSGDRIFLLLTQSSEYDRFRYPLPVKKVPFTREEYAETIRILYEDNRQMHESLVSSDCIPNVLIIEQKIAEYNTIVNEIRAQKDAEIFVLKKKIKKLKQKLAENPWHVPPPQFKLQ
jgi:coiled-coil domain-containing protein 61